MRPLIIFFTLFLFAANTSKAQSNLAPAYLKQQVFPDSVANVKLNNIKNGKVSFAQLLEKHSGKKIVIDFWASWCRDCIIGFPKLKKLHKKTSESKVVFVNISVDKNEDKWKEAIHKYALSGEQYQTETGWKNALTNYIELDWIPRFIVINEEGEIILDKAISSYDSQLKKAIFE